MYFLNGLSNSLLTYKIKKTASWNCIIFKMTITFHYLNFKSQIHIYFTISHSKLVQYISSSMKHAPAFLFFSMWIVKMKIYLSV